jgi:hypothetical protein
MIDRVNERTLRENASLVMEAIHQSDRWSDMESAGAQESSLWSPW